MRFLPRLKPACAPVLATLLVLSLQPGVLADGRHEGGHGHGDDAHGVDIGEPGKAADVSRTVDVTMVDTHFKPSRITVQKGETVRFFVHNKGTLVHEFNIGTADMHAHHRKEMMTMVEQGILEGDRINHARMKKLMAAGKAMAHDDPNSVLLEPGKSARIVWKFDKAATLEFACNVPGHYEAGMKGTIRVR